MEGVDFLDLTNSHLHSLDAVELPEVRQRSLSRPMSRHAPVICPYEVFGAPDLALRPRCSR